MSSHQNEEAEGDDFDGQHIAGSSPTDEMDEEPKQSSQIDCADSGPEEPDDDLATKHLSFRPVMEKMPLAYHDFPIINQDEKDEGNALPLYFEVFEILRRGFQAISKGHASGFPGLSLSEILRNRENHALNLERPCTKESNCESMIENNFPVGSIRACDIRKWEMEKQDEDIELTMEEENEEEEHTELSLCFKNEEVETSLITALQCHPTQ